MNDKIVDFVRSLFQESLDDCSFKTVNDKSTFLDWERAGVLFENRLIPSQHGRYSEIVVKEDGKNIFEMKWAIFDDVAYINWIKIDKKHRRKGIASSVRRKVVNGLFSEGCREIFTIPSSSAGESLVKSQGFSKTNVQPQENYTIYSLSTDGD